MPISVNLTAKPRDSFNIWQLSLYQNTLINQTAPKPTPHNPNEKNLKSITVDFIPLVAENNRIQLEMSSPDSPTLYFVASQKFFG